MRTLFVGIIALLAMTAVTAETPRAPRPPVWESAANSSPMQTVVSRPNIIDFTSADHNATDAGAPVVTSYEVTLFLVGSSTPAKAAVDIGKPASATTAVSYTNFSSVWAGLPAGQYNAKVTVKGPGGTATSPLSATPFSVDPRPGAAPGAPTFRQ